MSKQSALDFFADLLPTPKVETLFDTPVVKPKRKARRWTVTGITVVRQVTTCRTCSASIDLVNPHIMLTKSLNDYDGRIMQSVDTDCPDDSDLDLITSETPVSHKEVHAGYVDVCACCLAKASSDVLINLFKTQVNRLKADPVRARAAAEKAEKAEKDLLALIADYEQTPTVRTDDDIVSRLANDSDLPY